MRDLTNQILSTLNHMPFLELTAMLLALAYLVFIMRENSLGWYCAFISTAIYTIIFWDVNLLMDAALNVYYMGMAVYGWLQWRSSHILNNKTIHNDTAHNNSLAVQRWPVKQHLIWLLLICLATIISGFLLNQHTQAAWPFLDSLTTWGSVFTTYLVARKVLENWWYWMVLNSISLFLYIDRALYLTAALFVIYLILSIFGYLAWRKSYLANVSQPAA